MNLKKKLQKYEPVEDTPGDNTAPGLEQVLEERIGDPQEQFFVICKDPQSQPPNMNLSL